MQIRTVLARVRTPLKFAFYLIMVAAVVTVARTMITDFSAERMKSILAQVPLWQLGAVAAAGLLAFTATGLYDLIAARHVGVTVRARDVLRIGLTSQAFTNFAGMGGLTGGTIRTREYTALGASRTAALGVSTTVWASNALGLLVLLLVTSPLAVLIDARLIIVVVLAALYLPVFLFVGRVHLGRLDLRETAFGAMSLREKLTMILASTVDWLAAGLFFWACVRLFGIQVDPWHALFVYATATIVGLLSFLPSGLGSFDITVLLLFQHLESDTSSMTLALIVFRVTYYLVPWLIALFFWAGRELRLDEVSRRQRLIANSVWLSMILASVLLFASALTPEITSRVRLLQDTVPEELRRASHLTVLMVAVVLLILARGIHKRLRRAWELSLAVSALAMIALLIRGLDWEEVTLLLLFSIGLVAAKGAFTRESLPLRWQELLPSLIPAVAVPVVLYLWHGFHTPILLYTLLAAVVALSAMFSRHRIPTFVGPDADVTARFEDLLARHGGNSYTHLLYLGDKDVFFSSDGNAALLYRPDGRILYGLGDPFGDPDSFPLLIAELIGYADDHRMGLVIYELDELYLGLYADEGFTFTKLGEDATVDISEFTLVGNKGKTLRRMSTHFRDAGLTFEILPPPFDASMITQLKDVSDTWLGDRREMGFSLGRFNESYIQRAPVALVRSAERLEGFATLMPITHDIASVDLMRIRPDAPSGTMDGIFVHLMGHAHEAGYRHFNLGMAPMSNTGNRPHSHGREKLLRLVYDYGGKVYGFHGLRSYKQKFRPRWRSRYLAYLEQASLIPALLGLLELVQRPDHYDSVTIPQGEIKNYSQSE